MDKRVEKLKRLERDCSSIFTKLSEIRKQGYLIDEERILEREFWRVERKIQKIYNSLEAEGYA